MTSAFLCPHCRHRLNVERDADSLVLWCGYFHCLSPAGDEGACGESEWEAYERLKDLMRDEDLPEPDREPETVEDQRERLACQKADHQNKREREQNSKEL